MEVHQQPVPYTAAPASTAADQDPYAPPTAYPVPPPVAQPGSLVEAVLAGHRYYAVPFVFSLAVITFRRTMGGVHEVSDGKWPVLPIAGATLITSVVGWWGFPWGIVYSIAALIRLWNGGKDLTKTMLQQAVGAEEAKRILAAAPKPVRPPSFWLVRLLVLVGLTPPAWLLFLFAEAILKA